MNNKLVEDILKVAGIRNALTGAAIGSGLGAMKGSSQNLDNPDMSVEDKSLNIGSKAIAGAAIGGAAVPMAGKGLNGIKNIGSKALGMIKKSEIEVPDEEEKSEARKEVLESPNPEEIKKINNSISKEKYKNIIEKSAQLYMKDSICEECGYEGKMDSSDGRCPNCQSMSGVQLKDVPAHNNTDDIWNKDQRESKIYDEIESAKKDTMSYY